MIWPNEPIPNHPDDSGPLTAWDVQSEKLLPRPQAHGTKDFFELLENRRTHRQLRTLALAQLADLLWLTTRTTSVSTDRQDLKRCPIPTAGGLGAVRTIVVREGEGAWLYDRKRHSAGLLRSADPMTDATLNEARAFIDTPEGDLLIFAADKGMLEHHYRHGESLVLREAGVLIGVMAVASEALGIGFCPLGTLGRVWASRLLGVCEEVIIPGGAAIVGGR